jgi:hypothetical protein
LTGDGVPGLIFTTFSFGAHCCTTIYVLSLRSQPKLPLQFFAGNGSYEIRDLKGNGMQEFILGDDSFSYFGGLSYAGSPSWLPLVVCYRNGSFDDCTGQFPEAVRDSIREFRSQLQDTELRIKSGAIEVSETWPADFWTAGPVLGIYADSVVLGHDGIGWATVLAQVGSERVTKWFECNRPTVQLWAKRRQEFVHRSEPHAIWNTPGCDEL